MLGSPLCRHEGSTNACTSETCRSMIEGVIMFCQINNLFSLSQSSLRSCRPYICIVSLVWILYNDTCTCCGSIYPWFKFYFLCFGVW